MRLYKNAMTIENITLDVDEEGIWLVHDDDEVVYQLGHISWRQIYLSLKQYEEQNESTNRSL
jgi:hypothetical protein